MKLTLAEVAPGEAMRWEWKTGDKKEDMRQFADILRQRARVGYGTRLSAETALLVAEALGAYAPAPPAPPPPAPARAHEERFWVDMYAVGSCIYKLDHRGEIFEIAAWARSTLVAHAAYDKLVEQYETDRFLQKRRSWIEREPS